MMPRSQRAKDLLSSIRKPPILRITTEYASWSTSRVSSSVRSGMPRRRLAQRVIIGSWSSKRRPSASRSPACASVTSSRMLGPDGAWASDSGFGLGDVAWRPDSPTLGRSVRSYVKHAGRGGPAGLRARFVWAAGTAAGILWESPFRREVMSRGLRRSAVALLIASLAAAGIPAQGTAGNQGVIFSEVVYGPSLPPVGGQPMPSYIELVNVQIANPVVPPPVPIGSAAAGPRDDPRSVGGQAPVTVTIPIGSFLGGNVQPAARAPQPPSPAAVSAGGPAISSGPFPPGVLPPPMPPRCRSRSSRLPRSSRDPTRCSARRAFRFELCFNNPATGVSDRIHLGPPAAIACSAAPFTNTGTFVPNSGRAIRWTYMDSNTDIDFDPTASAVARKRQPADGPRQRVLLRDDDFAGARRNAAHSPTGTPTAGTFMFPPTAHVKSVNFFKPGVPQPDRSPIRSSIRSSTHPSRCPRTTPRSPPRSPSPASSRG